MVSGLGRLWLGLPDKGVAGLPAPSSLEVNRLLVGAESFGSYGLSGTMVAKP